MFEVPLPLASAPNSLKEFVGAVCTFKRFYHELPLKAFIDGWNWLNSQVTDMATRLQPSPFITPKVAVYVNSRVFDPKDPESIKTLISLYSDSIIPDLYTRLKELEEKVPYEEPYISAGYSQFPKIQTFCDVDRRRLFFGLTDKFYYYRPTMFTAPELTQLGNPGEIEVLWSRKLTLKEDFQ